MFPRGSDIKLVFGEDSSLRLHGLELNRLIFATNLRAAAELSKVTMKVFKVVSPFLAGYSVIAPSRSYFTASDFVCLFVQRTAVFTPHFYAKD